MFVMTTLALTLAAVLAGRRRDAQGGVPARLGSERVLAVFRPNPDLSLTLAALACAALGIAHTLAILALGRPAPLPVDLALGAMMVPAVAGRVRGAWQPWVLTEGRLIPGGGAPLPLDRVAGVQVRALSLVVVVRGTPGAAGVRLRSPALADPRGAARVIRAALRDRQPRTRTHDPPVGAA